MTQPLLTTASTEVVARLRRPVLLTERTLRILFALGGVVFAVVLTLAQGKVLHWDAVNYHFYLGFAALNDRYGTDFFAAGTPSYINPYAYVPLHLMVAAGWSGAVVATVLALAHGLIFWVTYELARVLIPGQTMAARVGFPLFAVVLAGMSPVVLQGLGLTLVDIPLGVFVVGAWVSLGIGRRDERLGWTFLGGLLGGLAGGLKLSNAFYAVAAMAIVAIPFVGWRNLVRATTVYVIGCGIGFLMVAAPWGWKLWVNFGNPLFPFMNDVFQSPDFTSAAIHYERFRPTTWTQYILRPFEMLSTSSLGVTEGRAPDLRFAVLAILLVGAPIWRMLIPSNQRRILVMSKGRPDRILLGVLVAFIIAWVLWLASSGNGRYFVPMGSVAAVLVAALLYRAHLRFRDVTLVALVLILLAQYVQTVVGSDWHRQGAEWDGPLLEVKFGDRFRNEPALYLSTSFLSGSALLSKWHPKSGMITTSGFYALGPGRPGYERAMRLIRENRERVRSLSLLPPGYDGSNGLPGPAADLNVYVARFGLEVDPSDCEFVHARTNLSGLHERGSADSWHTWVSCRLVVEPKALERYLTSVQDPDLIFDRVEATCPNLFHPPHPATEQFPNWTRLYNMGSEMQLWIAGGRVMYRSPLLGGDPIDIGSAQDWLKGVQAVDCSKRYSPAFGLVGR